MATLQASLLCKPCLSFTSSFPPKQRLPHSVLSPHHHHHHRHHHHNHSFNPLCFPELSFHPISSDFSKLRFRPRGSAIFCTFRSENASSWSESNSLGGDSHSIDKESDVNGIDGEHLNLSKDSSVLDSKESRVDGTAVESSKIELQSSAEQLNFESDELGGEGKSEELVESEVKSANLGGNEVGDARLPIVVFFVGLWATIKEKMLKAFSDLANWWPFWRQEKRLARLISEADANPQDAAKQSALFVELNKHRLVNGLLWFLCSVDKMIATSLLKKCLYHYLLRFKILRAIILF